MALPSASHRGHLTVVNSAQNPDSPVSDSGWMTGKPDVIPGEKFALPVTWVRGIKLRLFAFSSVAASHDSFATGAFLHTRAGYSCGSLYFQREYGVHNRSASIHVEDLAGHPTRFLHADEHRCIRDVLRGPSSPRRTPSDFMPGFNRLLHLRWETNQYTAIDQVSCTEDDARAE